MKYAKLSIILLIMLCGGISISYHLQNRGSLSHSHYLSPWANKFPHPYKTNSLWVKIKEYFDGEWANSSVEKYPDAVKKAKEVVAEWGWNFQDKPYRGIGATESKYFVCVHFEYIPWLDKVNFKAISVVMTKDKLEIETISIGP